MSSEKKEDVLLPSEYYAKVVSDRKPYETRAEKAAIMTIPALMRDKSWSEGSETKDNYGQAFGARCVNNFVAKVGTTLFPPNASAFRLTPDVSLMKQTLGSKGSDSANKDIVAAQNKISDRLEANNTRNTIFGVLEHLSVVSSCVLEKVTDGGYKIHTLRNFVVSLNDRGVEYKICVKELRETLPEGISVKEEKDEYELYTQLEEVEPNKWIMTQEIEGELVGKESTFDDDTRPFSYQGWLWTQGDKYHRPYIDSSIEGFNEYSTWTKVLVKGGLISSKNITFVDERSGRTRLRDVKKAENGAIIQGNMQDVTSYQHGKTYDYQTAVQCKADCKEDLSYAWLLQVVRDSERTTAEEIKTMTAELQNALAGMYSIVSNNLIRRMVLWAMQDLGLKLKAIKVEVVTGLNALGRATEAQKMDELMTRAGQLGFADRFNLGAVATKYASYYNVDTTDILMTDEEYKAMRQQQQQASAMAQGEDELMKSAGQATGQQVAPQQ